MTKLPAIAPVVVAVASWLGPDAMQFHEIVIGSPATPWYSPSWLSQPYTNARLVLRPHREYWTTNAIGTERWLVREVPLGSHTFWTVLHREAAAGALKAATLPG